MMRVIRRFRAYVIGGGAAPVAPGSNIITNIGDLIVTDTGVELVTS